MSETVGPRIPALDDQLCFALYSATNAVVRAYRPLLENAGLTYPQYLIMLVLWRESRQTVTELAGRLKLGVNAVSQTLDRMENNGLLTRHRDASDRRSVHIELTDRGRDLEATVTPMQRDVACQTTLTPEELAGMRDLLQGLVNRMSDDDSSATAGGSADEEAPGERGTRRGPRLSP